LFFGGGGHLLGWQTIAVLASAGYAFGATYLIARLVDRTMGLWAGPEDEARGLDLSLHGESAYSASP
jgi:Amt family ammonium transporter